MRRSILASVRGRFAIPSIAAASSLALAACEDGPAQTFNPAPPNAGGYWNGQPDAAAVVDPAVKGFGDNTQGTGTNKQELCDAATKAKVWARMVQQPILPPSKAGGLDIAGGSTWAGLTIEQAETPVWDATHTSVLSGLCQGDELGDLRNDGTSFVTWGDGQEVAMVYRLSDRKAVQLLLLPGYLGTVTAKSRDGLHNYEIPIQSQIRKDNNPFTITWDTSDLPHGPPSNKGPGDWRNELHDALIATYAPFLAQSDDCNADGRCIEGKFGDVAYFFIPALGVGLWVPSRSAAQPQPSILDRIDQYLAKITPFASAPPLMKLDAEGPTANAGKLGTSQNPCVLKIGVKFSDFVGTCVKVTGDTTKDTNEYNKLLGGLTHGTERFHFDITGIDVNFTNNHLAADTVTSDADRPANDDTSSRFTVDQSALGKIANEYTNNDTSQPLDRHGAGWVYFDFARSVQEQLNALMGGAAAGFTHTLGDPACTGGQTDAQLSAANCTGFEGFITQAPAAKVKDATMAKVALGIVGQTGYGLTSLKPGHHKVVFCNDLSTGSSKNCGELGRPGPSGDTFATSFARILAILGQGKTANLPVEAQDVRFFFRAWFTSLLKYLKNASNTALDSETLHSQVLNAKALYFDSTGSGQFEIGEYVDRDFVDATHPPTDVVFTADVKNGIMNDYDFSRELLRGELAMYTAMTDHRVADDPPGKQDTALLTNMFGSPVLATGWSDHTTTSDTIHTAFYCATHATPADVTACKGQVAPTDALGNVLLNEEKQPILAPYEGAIGASRTVFALGTTPATPIKILTTDQNILSAMVQVPLHTNPYDTTTPPPNGGGASMRVLIPWAPKSPTVGFPVALDGTRDKFIESYQLDLGGTQITANIDYDFQYDPNTHLQLDTIQFNAVETTDFLGDIFICQDPNTHELLSARMYTSVSTILAWFANHPGAYQSCQMIIRYSPYGNYADYITSLQNGVRLGITQGGGYGRVVDGTLFTPGQ
jgi:hypothetical protein